MIQAMIFDMDGLMLDTERLTERVWHKVGEEMGYRNAQRIMPETMGVRSDVSRRIFFRYFGDDFPYDAFIRRSKELSDEFIEKNGVPVKPGLFELLRYLLEKHVRAAVATSTSRERAERYLEKAGVTPYFNRIICGDMVKKSKPDPDIYLTAAYTVGADPRNCVALEDSLIGCESALAAGMKTVMVPDLVQPGKSLISRLFACVPALDSVIPLMEGLAEEKRRE